MLEVIVRVIGEDKVMNIILLAPPAAGKGTQAEILVSKYNLNHISTGNLLRSTASIDNEFGRNLKEVLESGVLVSDDIVLEVLNNYLKKTDNSNLLLDGFPRNIYQAEKLDEILKEQDKKVDYVFLLNVEKEILLNRILGRRLCKNCSAIYNVNIEPLKPKVDSICDKCGSPLIARSDDNRETFQIRYNEYVKETEPLISYYQNQHKLYEIDCSGSREEITKQIGTILENK